MKSKKKVSVVVPCYNTEKYVERCIESLLGQSYKNLELILVNDCSPGNMLEILEKYKELDDRVVIVNNEKNKGLFHARLAGADVSSGDYICFVDSDDYVSCDFLRGLVYDLEEKKADMVFCNTVLDENHQKFLYNLFDFHLDELNGEDCLKYYFEQKGICYRWHTVWNKLYTMKLWKQARKYYDSITTHLIMTEDFAFSTVLFRFCQKIVFNEYANYYYCSNDDASTSLVAPNLKKFEKNISDIFISFEFVREFLKKEKLYSKYQIDYEDWYRLYLKIWHDNVSYSTLEEGEKELLLKKLFEKDEKIAQYTYKNELNFYQSKVPFQDQYEKIIANIMDEQYSVISFDIFDTLIARPFYEPKDLFKLLNKKYLELVSNSAIVFSDIREQAEALCRKYVYQQNYYEEVTLDEIYDYIKENYAIKEVVLEQLKKYEVSLELKLCTVKRSGQNLFRLAQEMNKRVIIVSDIYLPRNVIEEILRENGYQGIARIYLSCEEKLSKSTRQLYKIVITQENVEPNQILHIGDNYGSDYENAKKMGIVPGHLPRAIDMMQQYIARIFLKQESIIDTTNYLSFTGVRISLAMVANKFFDNPWVSFQTESEFNCDPALIGYFALGMHTFSTTKWIYDDLRKKQYDSVTFMARDGFLIKDQFDKFQTEFSSKIHSSYLPISRKSLIPYSFERKEDYIKLVDYFPYDTVSPSDIIQVLEEILVLGEIEKDWSNHKFQSCEEFLKFLIQNIIPNIDEGKLKTCRGRLKEYFLQFFVGKSANFDIGYSAKPENTLTNLLSKPIDTYFIHFNDNNAYYYSNSANFDLNLFYSYKPKFTGMLREYMLSELKGSCKKYVCHEKEVEVVYDDIKIDYYEKWILDMIQCYSKKFTEDMLSYFSENLEELYFPTYYMSIPYEYFLHCASEFDRRVFRNLMFENSMNDNVNIETLWKEVVDNSNQVQGSVCQTYDAIVSNFYQLNVQNRNKFIKLLYYLFFDRVSLRKKVKEKVGGNSFLGKVLRKGYHFLKRG